MQARYLATASKAISSSSESGHIYLKNGQSTLTLSASAKPKLRSAHSTNLSANTSRSRTRLESERRAAQFAPSPTCFLALRSPFIHNLHTCLRATVASDLHKRALCHDFALRNYIDDVISKTSLASRAKHRNGFSYPTETRLALIGQGFFRLSAA